MHPLQLSWTQLYVQFGANPAKAGNRNVVNAFRTDCLRELKKITIAWPALEYATPKGGLEIRPTKPLIKPVARGWGRRRNDPQRVEKPGSLPHKRLHKTPA